MLTTFYLDIHVCHFMSSNPKYSLYLYFKNIKKTNISSSSIFHDPLSLSLSFSCALLSSVTMGWVKKLFGRNKSKTMTTRKMTAIKILVKKSTVKNYPHIRNLPRTDHLQWNPLPKRERQVTFQLWTLNDHWCNHELNLRNQSSKPLKDKPNLSE